MAYERKKDRGRDGARRGERERQRVKGGGQRDGRNTEPNDFLM